MRIVFRDGPLDGMEYEAKTGEIYFAFLVKYSDTTVDWMPVPAKTSHQISRIIRENGVPQWVYAPAKGDEGAFMPITPAGIQSLTEWAEGRADAWCPRP